MSYKGGFVWVVCFFFKRHAYLIAREEQSVFVYNISGKEFILNKFWIHFKTRKMWLNSDWVLNQRPAGAWDCECCGFSQTTKSCWDGLTEQTVWQRWEPIETSGLETSHQKVLQAYLFSLVLNTWYFGLGRSEPYMTCGVRFVLMLLTSFF